MELDIIKLRTTWNDAAGSINSNYAKIADAIAQLKANGGGGGGGADIDLTDYATKVWVEAKGYITASALTPYALKTDIPSLDGYATEDFVNNKLGDYATKDYVTTKLVDYAPLTNIQGFENRIGGLESAVPQLNERVSIVEGEVSSLNETVSTGENNLLDRVNTIETDYVTSGNLESAINDIDLSVYLLKADLTKSRIQSTLGISDWALASAKPTYTASEVGALSVSKELNSGSLNDYTTAGIYRFNIISDGSERMGPYGNLLVVRGGTNDTLSQLYFNYYDGKAFIRSSNTSGLSSANWNTIAFTSDIPTKLSQFTDDVVAGKYLRSTIYGNNYDADTLFNDGFRSGYMSHLPSGSPYGVVHTLSYKGGSNNVKPAFASQIFIPCGDDSTSPNDMFFRTSLADSWNGWNKVITDKNIGNYKAGNSDKLNAEYLADLNNGTRGRLFYSAFQAANTPPGANYFAGLTFGYDSLKQLAMSYDGKLYTRYYTQHSNTPTWSNWKKVAFTDSNVASATKLQTRCKLWGKDFDGTADVSGNLISDIWRIIKDYTWNGTFIQSANYDGTSDLGNIYMTARHGNKLTSFNVWANDSKFTNNVIVGGNVGIGNESPTEKLDVAGNVKASGDITANKFIGSIRGNIIYDNGTDEGHFIGLGSNGVGVKGLLNYVYGNFPILFYTNGFERMRIGEYVGIGTTSPTERLDVGGNIKASGNINATSITINGVTITASNGSITVNGNVFATGDITGGV